MQCLFVSAGVAWDGKFSVHPWQRSGIGRSPTDGRRRRRWSGGRRLQLQAQLRWPGRGTADQHRNRSGDETSPLGGVQAAVAAAAAALWKAGTALVRSGGTAAATASAATATAAEAPPASGQAAAGTTTAHPPLSQYRLTRRMVLITGFETFNLRLYREAAREARARVPELEVLVYTERDLDTENGRQEVGNALRGAEVVLCSLLFDFDVVEWLRPRLQHVPVRLVYECSVELMACTQVGTFTLGGGNNKSSGMPPAVRLLLSKMGLGGREEDKMAGYLSFLKTGPRLLKYIPLEKAQDLRRWLEAYARWNGGGLANVVSLCMYVAHHFMKIPLADAVPNVVELPAIGLVHPELPLNHPALQSPAKYVEWYLQRHPHMRQAPRAGMLLYRKHVISEQPYIAELIRLLEREGVLPIPVYINGVEAHIVVRDLFTTVDEQQQRRAGHRTTPLREKDAATVDVIVSTIGFPLVGGPAGTMSAGRHVDVAQRLLSIKNVPYMVAGPLIVQDSASWKRNGVIGLQSIVLYALPELDGAIDTVVLGGLVGDQIQLVPERVGVLAARIRRWTALRRKPNADKHVAIVLYGFPPGVGATGTAALLNVPRSLIRLLRAMREQGYDLGDDEDDGGRTAALLQDDSGAALVQQVRRADEITEGSGVSLADITTVSAEELESWLPLDILERVQKNWGGSLTRSGIKTLGKHLCLGGVRLGKVWVAVQPPLGLPGDPMRLLFERDATPHPQYIAFYLWVRRHFDAVLHFGMHGTAEWLPGQPLGNDEQSFSDLLLRDLPNIYIYAQNNPSESALAKRRGYGTIISHNVPPYGRAGLYGQLLNIRDQVREIDERYRPGSDAELDPYLLEALHASVQRAGLDADLPADALLSGDTAAALQYVGRLREYLAELESRLFSEGLHTLGAAPSESDIERYCEAIRTTHESSTADGTAPALDEAAIRALLLQSTDELHNVMRALRGEYIPAAPGGDLIRDGAGVLPTGRNIHALDPFRVPSEAAFRRGREIALAILEQHRAKNDGAYPETVAVMLWGLDSIKTRGESVGTVLELVGARPLREATGRVVRFELVPLAEMQHPRIDVLCSLSGIFRDAFENVVLLLDDLFVRAAQAPDESPDQNYIKRHAGTVDADGRPRRLWSNPPSEFGSLVADRVETSTWNSSDELADTFVARNAFAYGRGERAVDRRGQLDQLLSTVDRVVQQVDSVEYGITDIQEYFANTGALARAAQTRKRRATGNAEARVTASFVESFGSASARQPRDLEQLLRLEYRSKLLNPRWADKMVAQGSGGVHEVSQRMNALLGWGAVAEYSDSFVFEQAADRYALDEKMAALMRQHNPQAFRNVVARLLEAAGRNIWKNADEARLEKLRALYTDIDAQIEGVA